MEPWKTDKWKNIWKTTFSRCHIYFGGSVCVCTEATLPDSESKSMARNNKIKGWLSSHMVYLINTNSENQKWKSGKYPVNWISISCRERIPAITWGIFWLSVLINLTRKLSCLQLHLRFVDKTRVMSKYTQGRWEGREKRCIYVF